MLNNVRCNFMLPNHCQCPNEAILGNDMCKIHIIEQDVVALVLQDQKLVPNKEI